MYSVPFLKDVITSNTTDVSWEGEITLNKSGDLPFSKQLSQTFGIKVEV